MKTEDQIKLFGLNNLSIDAGIRNVEKHTGILFQQIPLDNAKDNDFYPQFPEHIRREAAAMARHYEIFYCFEIKL